MERKKTKRDKNSTLELSLPGTTTTSSTLAPRYGRAHEFFLSFSLEMESWLAKIKRDVIN
jgi:hypothetical protein